MIIGQSKPRRIPGGDPLNPNPQPSASRPASPSSLKVSPALISSPGQACAVWHTHELARSMPAQTCLAIDLSATLQWFAAKVPGASAPAHRGDDQREIL